MAILDDIPSPIDLRDPHHARTWADTAEQRPWRPLVRSKMAALVRLQPRVLELGPGPGLLAAEALTSAAITSYTLFDFSPPFLEMCRARLSDPRLHFVLGDFTQPFPPFTEAPFDAVIAMQAVHEARHKRHVPALYRRAFDVLRPGGLLAICDHVPRDDDKSRALHSTLAEQHAAMSAAGFTAVSTVIDDPLMYLCCARRPA